MDFKSHALGYVEVMGHVRILAFHVLLGKFPGPFAPLGFPGVGLALGSEVNGTTS